MLFLIYISRSLPLIELQFRLIPAAFPRVVQRAPCSTYNISAIQFFAHATNNTKTTTTNDGNVIGCRWNNIFTIPCKKCIGFLFIVFVARLNCEISWAFKYLQQFRLSFYFTLFDLFYMPDSCSDSRTAVLRTTSF